MRCSHALVLLVLVASCSGGDGSGASTAPARQGPIGGVPQPVPGPPTLAEPQTPTNAVLLAFLVPDDSLVALNDGVETLVQQYEVYAPCHENFASMPTVRPVIGCPLPYTVWATQLDVAPMTVVNDASTAATLTVTTYSDNVYVYQQQQTVLPGTRSTIALGTMQLGYICSDGGPAMPISVSIRATGANLVLTRSTGVPATLRGPSQPDYPSVWGAAVLLLPLDGEKHLCG